MDNLYAAGLEQASFHLAKRGTLYPFIVRIGLDGDISTAMIDQGPKGPTNGDEVAEAHWDLLRKTRDESRAVALVLDVYIRAVGSDAVSILCEHRDGLALALNPQYARKGFPKKLSMSETSVSAGIRTVWPERATS